LELLHHYGAELGAVSLWKTSSLSAALVKGNLDCFTFLLSRSGDAVKQCDTKGYTPLHYAASNISKANLQALTELLAHGSPVNAKTVTGETAISLLAQVPGGRRVAQLRRKMGLALLAAGADPAIANQAGFTPLMWSLKKSHFGLADVLLSAADATSLVAVQNNGNTALHHLMYQGQFDNIMPLFDKFIARLQETGSGDEMIKAALETRADSGMVRWVGAGHGPFIFRP
jgi:ankyrin repeat protein